MIKRDHLLKRIFLFAGDFTALYAALFLALRIRYYPALDWGLLQQHIIPFTIVFAVWIFFFAAFGLYDLRLMKNSRYFLYRLVRVIITNTIVTILIFYLLPFFEIEPRRNLFLIAAVATILMFAWRYLFNLIIIRSPSSRILFFGATGEARELTDYLIRNPQLGQKPAGFITNGEDISYAPNSFGLPCFTPHQNFTHIIRDTRTDIIVIAREIKENKTLVNFLFQTIPLGVGVLEFPAFYERLTGKVPLSLIGEVWFLENLVGVKKGLWEFFKRTLDLFLALILGVPLLALYIPIAIAIKLDSSGPVFFRQKRAGRNGVIFRLVKFRSMVEDAESIGGFKTNGNNGVMHDPRQTRVGAFLRKNYLDELPQIINVLRGEMSFVGPRPERPEYIEQLKERIPFYKMRLLVLPGLTGWAQINMEDDASVEDAPQKMQYDLYYVKNRSFALDLLIAIRTIFSVLQRSGR